VGREGRGGEEGKCPEVGGLGVRKKGEGGGGRNDRRGSADQRKDALGTFPKKWMYLLLIGTFFSGSLKIGSLLLGEVLDVSADEGNSV